MVVVERHGLPLGFLLASANRAEAPLAEQTLDTLCVRPVCGLCAAATRASQAASRETRATGRGSGI